MITRKLEQTSHIRGTRHFPKYHNAMGSHIRMLGHTKIHKTALANRNFPGRARHYPAFSSKNRDVDVPSAQQQSRLPKASFSETPAVVKALVAGLTNLVNATAGESPGGFSSEQKRNNRELDGDLDLGQDVICLEDLKDGISKDFTDSGYLWSGEISEGLYDVDCEFMDPTLSFKGLDTFKRNIANLKPWLDRLLVSRDVILKSCELREDLGVVRASWRMIGDLQLPWSPRIDLSGQTDFVYDPEKGNRVVKYVEVWDVSAGSALLQIFIPGPPRTKN